MSKVLLAIFVTCVASTQAVRANDDFNGPPGSSARADVKPKNETRVLKKVLEVRKYLSSHPIGTLPCELEGVIQSSGYWKDSFVLGCDEGFGVPCISPSDLSEKFDALRVGDRVRLSGRTVEGQFKVAASSYEVIGHVDSISSKPIRFTDGIPQVVAGGYYSVKGVVREIAKKTNEIALWVDAPDGGISISYRSRSPIDEDTMKWLGKSVCIEGNLKLSVIPTTLVRHSALLCTDRSQIKLKADESGADAKNLHADENSSKLFGVVEYVEPNQSIVIAGKRVKTKLTHCLRAGDRLEVVNQQAFEKDSPRKFFKIGENTSLSAVKVLDIPTAARQIPDLQVTSIKGIVSNWSPTSSHWICTVTDGEAQIKAFLPLVAAPNSERLIERIPAGSLVRFRGVVERPTNVDSDEVFHLKVGRIEDAVLIRDKANLRADKLLFALMMISGIVASCLLWIVSLGQQVRSRTRALQIAQEEQFHIEKMNSVAQLAGGIAHDFNNLLTAISANLCLAELEAQNPAKLRKRVAIANSAVERAGTLTKYLLDFARQSPLNLQTIHVSDVVAQAAELMRCTLSPSIQFDCSVEENLRYCRADSIRLEQVLLNLCFNARDALRDNTGSIAIRAMNEWHRSLGKCVRISVEDSGVGIPLDVQSNIFEPFFTTKAIGCGTGLGLSTSLGIVEQHKGKIECRSVVGQGTRFDIFIPACDAHERPIPRIEFPKLADITNLRTYPLRILLVDDEPLLRESNCQLLSALGHDVVQAENGQVALIHLRRDQAFDLVLLDLTMPVMSGREALVMIKTEFPDLRVVICSGYAAESHALDSSHDSVKPDGFLEKPFSIIELNRILNDCSQFSKTSQRAAA
jgi:signal transduction histidine kinase/CheY-like chemotaxis protein